MAEEYASPVGGPGCFGGPDVHYVDDVTRLLSDGPACGFSGFEVYTMIEDNTTCPDCRAILGI